MSATVRCCQFDDLPGLFEASGGNLDGVEAGPVVQVTSDAAVLDVVGGSTGDVAPQRVANQDRPGGADGVEDRLLVCDYFVDGVAG
jgi:hypothetical protein